MYVAPEILQKIPHGENIGAVFYLYLLTTGLHLLYTRTFVCVLVFQFFTFFLVYVSFFRQACGHVELWSDIILTIEWRCAFQRPQRQGTFFLPTFFFSDGKFICRIQHLLLSLTLLHTCSNYFLHVPDIYFFSFFFVISLSFSSYRHCMRRFRVVSFTSSLAGPTCHPWQWIWWNNCLWSLS